MKSMLVLSLVLVGMAAQAGRPGAVPAPVPVPEKLSPELLNCYTATGLAHAIVTDGSKELCVQLIRVESAKNQGGVCKFGLTISQHALIGQAYDICDGKTLL